MTLSPGLMATPLDVGRLVHIPNSGPQADGGLVDLRTLRLDDRQRSAGDLLSRGKDRAESCGSG